MNFILHRDRILLGAGILLCVLIGLGISIFTLVFIWKIIEGLFDLLASKERLNLGGTIATLILVSVPIIIYLFGTIGVAALNNYEKKEALKKSRISVIRKQKQLEGFSTTEEGYWTENGLWVRYDDEE